MKFSTKKRAPSPSPSTSTMPTSNRSALTPVNTHHRDTSPRHSHSTHADHHAVNPQILSLTLENSSLKSQLATLTDSGNDTLELSNLLHLSNQKNESLQSKVDELHAGLKEIEKERRLLKSSVVKDREEYARHRDRAQAEIEAMRELLTVESKRVEMLEEEVGELRRREVESEKALEENERFVKMREKELAVLQGRVESQERRIEVINEEGLELKRRIEKMEEEKRSLVGQCEELAGVLEGVRGELGECQDEVAKSQERESVLSSELDEVRAALEREKQQSEADGQEFDAKEKRLREELHEAELQKQQKDEKIEELSKLLEAADVKQTEFEKTLQQKNESIADLNTQLEQREAANQSLQNEVAKVHNNMEQMSLAHEEILSQKDTEVSSWKEQKQAVDNALAAAQDLQQQLEGRIQSQTEAHAELSSKYDDLEQENGELAAELGETKRIIASLEKEFANTRDQVEKMEQRNTQQENELKKARQECGVSRMEVEKLTGQIEILNATHEEEMAHASKCRAELEAGLKFELETSNDLRSKLEKMGLQAKRDVEGQQQIINDLEQELESERSRNRDEVELIKSECAAQIEELETTGASVVMDLEASLDSLKTEISNKNLTHEQTVTQLNQTISRVQKENESLNQQVVKYEKQTASQEEKIAQLSNLSQHRGEEIIALQKELTFHRDSLEIAKRDNAKTLDAITTELEDMKLSHEQETMEMQQNNRELRSQLSAANARLEAEDEELNQVKSKLAERTQLLKEMMTKLKADKALYEEECARANQLSETIEMTKSELNEARTRARHYEQEKNDQESHFRETLRKERQQRKAIEKQLESFDALRKKYTEMEKENINLKDKITRQENYIGKLHDRQERDRRRAAAPLGASKANRPSTAPMSPPKDYSGSRGSAYAAKKRYTAQEVMQGQSFTSNGTSVSASEDGLQNENNHPMRITPRGLGLDESDLTMG